MRVSPMTAHFVGIKSAPGFPAFSCLSTSWAGQLVSLIFFAVLTCYESVRHLGPVCRNLKRVESESRATGVKKDRVVDTRPALVGAPGVVSLPDDFTLEVVLPENPVEHDFDVVGGVPVAVIIKAAGLFEDARQF